MSHISILQSGSVTMSSIVDFYLHVLVDLSLWKSAIFIFQISVAGVFMEQSQRLVELTWISTKEPRRAGPFLKANLTLAPGTAAGLNITGTVVSFEKHLGGLRKHSRPGYSCHE